MENKVSTDTSGTSMPGDISLVRGGLLHRFLKLIRVDDDNSWNVARRVLFVFAVVWLPVFAIQLVAAPSRVLQSLLDYRLEARALAAVILIVAEPIMDSRFRFLIEHIRESHLLIGPGLVEMDRVLARLRRVRDSFLPEALFLVAVAVRAATSYSFIVEQTSGDLSYQSSTGVHLSAAGWYGLLVRTGDPPALPGRQ